MEPPSSLNLPLSLKTMYDIAEFIVRSVELIDPQQTEKMIDRLADFYDKKGGKVLVMGAGRSGLVGRAFAMSFYTWGIMRMYWGKRSSFYTGERYSDSYFRVRED